MSRSTVWRTVGRPGEAYPAWVRDLKGKSGVYLIRDAGSSRVAYVGESHTDRLYETLTRHFQRWRRKKGFWAGFFDRSENDPGVTYDRGAVEVSVRVTPRNRALSVESALIARLKPTDNREGAGDVPF